MPAPDVHAVLAIVAGLPLVTVPAHLRRRIEDERSARLAELQAGAEESYFDEKRSLQAYASPAAEILRAAGFVLLALSLAQLWSRYGG